MRILLIEDNKNLCEGIAFHLKKAGYSADACYDGDEALLYLLSDSYDLIILDRMLPGTDGLSLLKQIRGRAVTTPVIMLTAMNQTRDKVDGLNAGADDYLGKPFETEELLARIRALSRRPPGFQEPDVLSFGDLQLDVSRQLLTSGAQSCSLSKKETELFEYFIKNGNQVLPRNRILIHVWGVDTMVEDGNLDNYIHFLRRRLKTVNSGVQIKTYHRAGYCLEVSSTC